MRNTLRRRLWVSALVVSSAASMVFAGASARPDAPHRFVNPALDGTPVAVENPVDGRTYSAWTYRSGPELDIAVAVRERPETWSLPVFFGRFDGFDQRSPALAVDTAGHVYLAYASSDSGRVFVTVHVAGTAMWSMPVPVSPEGVRATAPALLVVADRLVVAFRTGSKVAVVQVPLLDGGTRPLGIQDGPDPVGRDGNGGAGSGSGSGSEPIRPGK